MSILFQVRESVLQSLISVDMEDLPVVVKFLLHSVSSTDALEVNVPCCEKIGLRGLRPGPTQTRLYNHTRWLEA